MISRYPARGRAPIAFLLVALAAVAHSATLDELAATAAAIRDAAATRSTAFATVESLTMNVGPRLAGSPGDARSVEWALARLRELGFQNVRAETVEVPHWERGELSVQLIEPVRQTLVATSLGGSVGTGSEGVEAAVVRVDSLDALAALPDGAVRDKIVFFDQRMERTRDGSGYGRTVGMRVSGPREAGKKGAVAVVIRSVGTSNDRIAHTGVTVYDPDTPQIPGLALSNPDADLLAWQIARAGTARLRIVSSARHLPPARSANIIGEIPGTDLADQIVLLGAHLDSWDLGTGAIDDGAGVAIVTAAAALVGEANRPRRTIRVVLFANEEFGLSGANAYLEAHFHELERHIVGLESDFGADRSYEFATRVGEDNQHVIDAIADVLAPLGIGRAEHSARGGADLGPLRAAGMPVFDLRQDGTRYFDFHHTDNDTLDKIDPEQLNQNVAAFAVVAYLTANADGDFGRLEIEPAKR